MGVLCPLNAETATWRCSVKKLFLKILKNSQRNTKFQGVFFDILTSFQPANLLKSRVQRMYFPINLRSVYEAPKVEHLCKCCLFDQFQISAPLYLIVFLNNHHIKLESLRCIGTFPISGSN